MNAHCKTRRPGETVNDNAAWASAAPVLSVLTPFYRDDPRPLLAILDEEAALLSGRVEIVLLDDGGGDTTLTEAVGAAIQALKSPARLVVLARNEGRARGRNRLTTHGRTNHLLFLDSDMAPDAPDFLARYLALIDAGDAPVVFGGFSLDQAQAGPEHALHVAMAKRAECLPAHMRAEQPEKYVFTSNLLVRRDVFEAEAFDEGFVGWGWEDVEWGMRVARRYGVLHIDNAATHLGLDTAETLAGKYEQSAGNFARVVAAHPQIVSTYPSYRMARALRRLPARGFLRAMLKRTALMAHGPLIVRIMAMKAYRAALYAEVIS